MQKLRRAGVLNTLFFAGIAGAIYAVLNWLVRKDYLLSADVDPMTALLTQLYGVISLLNVFAIIVSTSNIYSIEHKNNGLRKMHTLPIKSGSVFLQKLIILVGALALTYVIEFASLAILGGSYLPSGTFALGEVLQFAFYVFLIIMPCLVFMLIISMISPNMWITVGIGIVGFFSGMSMVGMDNRISYLNPFVLLLKPAMELTSGMNIVIISIAIIETIVLILLGIFIANKKTEE
ncbi:ABC transporter permease [Terribacillus saccharophilus]|nr:ABC transporter permease [Terribacillus saccharophilus]